MTSEMDLLRQENARLMAENAEFKVKYDEAKDEITKLRAELRNRIEELEKARIDTAVENTRRDVENVRRDAENAELKARVAKLEEDSRHPRKDSSPKKLADIPDSVIANEVVSVNSKSSEEKMMDSFLDEVNKKIVSDGIRQRKRDEKLAKVESISPEKGKQVSVDKRALRKENQKKQREKFIQEVSEGAVTEVTSNDSILSLGSNSLDVCLEKTIRSCDPLAVEMRTPTFSLLYEKLCDAVILADPLIQRRGEIASEKQVDPGSNTVSRILNIEVKAQLPTGTSDALLRKRIEQAKKLYTLFNAIGMDKIKRIHSFSADSISKMTYEDIQYIIDNIPFDYSIHMETQLCEPSSQSDKKNSDLSHITISDAPTESQVPNESAPKKFDTKVEVIPPISQPNSPTYDRTYFRNKALDQYPNLYREFSSEKFDYYGITDETSCPLCKLDHDDEDGIEGRYETRSYFIKCEQREIEIVA
ncbi:hypothetical protein GLOIN_2v1582864 [Rhizophagus irregularis DAOM 181602=DAOM 197198]|uniref:Uncharacterized protein n=1 Tax=Rhizophagus irregularis (strain DAOM 181602 / DAOM 197198 / MUCL 43194) TaxID=747089 RepID=A0A2P4Q870_RHIID|nr:hypothetical protein GLOIN_2v1582864 [Rhizophagus irregularis DAOM 181602=DAOM 197198]POG73798.1 hypothetical protein GLOIN_2v1582864 [Rhizophagus irregularis DAOM 181602=DAOM 197198]|eukprot:XP_025180664.1 hypothetical protein GLOIN_2v1582864 [Rhizophagus irregularis DAOM 181602=DAOM 197198]